MDIHGIPYPWYTMDGEDIIQKRFLGEDIIQKRLLGEDISKKLFYKLSFLMV